MILLTATTESGIYRIVNETTDTVYIGSAVKIRTRLQSHLGMLRRGVHDNIHLQRAWERDGEDAFVFEALAHCQPDELIATEQWWVDYLRSHGTPLFNLRAVVDSQFGFKHTPESRKRMSEAKRKMSPETKAKIAAASRRYAREHPEEMKARRALSSGSKGTTYGPETRSRMSAAQQGRGPVSEATRAKLRAARAGRRPGLGVKPSVETLAKRGAAIAAAAAAKTTEERSAIIRKGWETRRAAA